MDTEELLQAIKYDEDPNKRCSIDEVLGLLAEYIDDESVITEVDKYISDYTNSVEQTFNQVEQLKQAMETLGIKL